MDFIVKRYNNKSSDCFNIKTKLFYEYGPGISKTWDHIQKTTENKIDGLIFTPVYRPIVFGRDNFLLKWKELNTIDFLVKMVSKNSKDKINLYYYKKILAVYKSFSSNENNFKRIMEFIKENPKNSITKGVIIEFKISNDFEIFTPYKIRLDKHKPNGEITLNNTLKNIKESIKVEELFV
jgi:hypothetical protein